MASLKDKKKAAAKTIKKVKSKAEKTLKEVKNKADTNSLAAIYTSTLDSVEKKNGIASGDLVTCRLSTGMLAFDLMLGGQMRPGMITILGMEASAKSTAAMEVLRAAVDAKVPIIEYNDPENSVEPTYTGNILKVSSLIDVFGERSEKGGWITPPKARYYDVEVMETVFDNMVGILNRIPDKLYHRERKKWYLVVSSTDKKIEHFRKSLGAPDSRLSREGKLWFEAPDDKPQALFIVDSWPSLLPESVDEKEEANNSLALQAREYSKHLPRIRGKLKRKAVIILGVNQLRAVPMAMYGPSEREPCGNALMFNSSVRFKLTARAVPPEWRHDSKISAFREEPSVEGNGFDQYAYKHAKNIKNKNGTPFLETWGRVWIKDRKGEGRGFDPVFDTFMFLQETGLARRLSVKKVGISVAFSSKCEEKHPLLGKTIPWQDFKIMILSETSKNKYTKELMAKLEKTYKTNGFKLRAWCEKLIKSGKAKDLMNDAKNNRERRNEDDDDLED